MIITIVIEITAFYFANNYYCHQSADPLHFGIGNNTFLSDVNIFYLRIKKNNK